MRGLNKKGQLNLSFGMIVSIIMIIIFLAFGFYVISKFLGMKNSVEIGKFIEGLRNDVDKMWRSSQGSQNLEYSLPTKIEYVCFVDYTSGKKGAESEIYEKLKQVYNGEENIFFYPVGSGEGIDSAAINHINIGKITENQNPFCLNNEKGKIKLTLKKNFDDALVGIT